MHMLRPSLPANSVTAMTEITQTSTEIILTGNAQHTFGRAVANTHSIIQVPQESRPVSGTGRGRARLGLMKARG